MSASNLRKIRSQPRQKSFTAQKCWCWEEWEKSKPEFFAWVARNDVFHYIVIGWQTCFCHLCSGWWWMERQPFFPASTRYTIIRSSIWISFRRRKTSGFIIITILKMLVRGLMYHVISFGRRYKRSWGSSCGNEYKLNPKTNEAHFSDRLWTELICFCAGNWISMGSESAQDIIKENFQFVMMSVRLLTRSPFVWREFRNLIFDDCKHRSCVSVVAKMPVTRRQMKRRHDLYEAERFMV